MSESSLSPTPTHNLSDTNITHYPQATISRPQTLENTPSERPVREYREPVTVRLSPPPPPSEPPRAESSSARLRRRRSPEASPEASPEEHMAKRIRRESLGPRGRPDDHSSPSSDSQDDMADNEMDVGKAYHPEPLPPASVQPKKKRTRTLTTPHQSAVLHALLAQSRFPTTAMREEVGRSIGLSARKVQIWFQNQRQKARRPRSQSDTPSNRPPQYGPFPSASESVAHGHRGFEEHGIDRRYYGRHPSPEPPHPSSAEIPARLLGPGMPGAPIYAPQSHRQIRPPPISAPPADSRYETGPPSFHRVMSPQPYRSPPMYSLPGVRPATSQPSSWRERDPSRTLPPLESTRPSSSSYGARRMQQTGGPAYPFSRPPTLLPPRSISPEARFAHHPPEPPHRHAMNIPPPFTLQPSPQWDQASYIPRPSSSAWSRPGSRSTRGRSTSPVAVRREHLGNVIETSDAYYLAEHTAGHHSSSPRSMPPATTPPSRPGRYDPVRATYVPFSTPTVSPAVSPARTGGGANDERAERNSSPVHEDR